MICFTGCANKVLEEPPSTETTYIDTLDKAVNRYIQEKESQKYYKGDYFAYSYRVLDTIESAENVTVYTHILCSWITSGGESVSGGAGLISINFNRNNNIFE